MSEKPCRRWFRFSLRTLFVALVLLSLPMAWYTRMRLWFEERAAAAEGQGKWVRADPMHDGADAPWQLRMLFHEFGIAHAYIRNGTDEQVAEAKRLFPEAEIIVFTGPLTYVEWLSDAYVQRTGPQPPVAPADQQRILSAIIRDAAPARMDENALCALSRQFEGGGSSLQLTHVPSRLSVQDDGPNPAPTTERWNLLRRRLATLLADHPPAGSAAP
ncbi:MAG TPA: hypothetical protein VHY91_14210 [Pirellulales bacterium]|jgi:hypothetical protein|nr:hypothetical protein [Pirellulales bacterium]